MSTTTWKEPIYFNLDEVESIAEEEASVTLTYTPSMIFPEDTQLEMEPPEVETFFSPTIRPPQLSSSPFPLFSPLTWLLGSLGILLISLLLINTFHFITQQYANHFLLGSFFLLVISSMTLAILVMAWKSYQNLQTLRIVTHLQNEGHQLLANNGHGNATHYLNKIAHFYLHHRPDLKTRLDRFYIILNDSHYDRDACHLFSTQVMKELDEQAYRLVAQRSQETALMVMVSQIALLDTLFTFWRNLLLIRDIATLYGGRPNLIGAMSLTTSVLQNLIYADVSEIIADNTAEIFGSSLLSVMSTQIAQGLGSGLLTARIGLQTMQLCRPLPFLDQEKPSLKGIRREILTCLKILLKLPNKT